MDPLISNGENFYNVSGIIVQFFLPSIRSCPSWLRQIVALHLQEYRKILRLMEIVERIRGCAGMLVCHLRQPPPANLVLSSSTPWPPSAAWSMFFAPRFALSTLLSIVYTGRNVAGHFCSSRHHPSARRFRIISRCLRPGPEDLGQDRPGSLQLLDHQVRRLRRRDKPGLAQQPDDRSDAQLDLNTAGPCGTEHIWMWSLGHRLEWGLYEDASFKTTNDLCGIRPEDTGEHGDRMRAASEPRPLTGNRSFLYS